MKIAYNVFTKFIKAVTAGMMIGIATTAYLSIENKIVGAFLFASGLFFICSFGLPLYTGCIGYFFSKQSEKKFNFPIILLGNLLGVTLTALLYKVLRHSTINNVVAISDLKFSITYFHMFLSAVCCGFLMYIAVDLYRTFTSGFKKYAGIFLAVPIFIICGFDHCIVDMFYIVFYNNSFFTRSIFMICAIMGNTVGSITARILLKPYSVDNNTENERKILNEKLLK